MEYVRELLRTKSMMLFAMSSLTEVEAAECRISLFRVPYHIM